MRRNYLFVYLVIHIYIYIYTYFKQESGIWPSCCWWRTMTKFQEIHTVGWVCEWLTWVTCLVLQLKGMEWMLAKQVLFLWRLVDFRVWTERVWWSSVCSSSVCCSIWSAGLLHLLVSSGLCQEKRMPFYLFLPFPRMWLLPLLMCFELLCSLLPV